MQSKPSPCFTLTKIPFAKFILAGLCFLSASQSWAGSKNLNIRYGLVDGGMLELGFGRLGLGASYLPLSASGSGTFGTYTASGNKLGARLSIYSSGMGSDSWYASALAGVITLRFAQTLGTTEYTATGTGAHYGGALGYHWFWSNLNLHLGIGYGVASFTATQLKSSTNTVGDTVPAFSLPYGGLDFGVGLAF